MEKPPRIIKQPTFDDSGGRVLSPPTRERSVSPLPSIKINKIEKPKDFTFLEPTVPREDLETEEDDEEQSLRGSSEFMLVLYPDEEPPLREVTSRTLGNVQTDLQPLQSKTHFINVTKKNPLSNFHLIQ